MLRSKPGYKSKPKYKELTDSQKVIMDILDNEGPMSFDNLFKRYKEIMGIDIAERQDFNANLSAMEAKKFVYKVLDASESLYDEDYYDIDFPPSKPFREQPGYTDLTQRQKELLELLDEYGPMSIEDLIDKYERVYLGVSFDNIKKMSGPNTDFSETEDLELDVEAFMAEKTMGSYFTHVTPAMNIFNPKPYIHTPNFMKKTSILDRYLAIYKEFNVKHPNTIGLTEGQIKGLVRSLLKKKPIIEKYHRDRKELSAIAHLMLKSELIRFTFDFISKSFKPHIVFEIMPCIVIKMLEAIKDLDSQAANLTVKNKITLVKAASSVLFEHDKFMIKLFTLKKYRNLVPSYSGKILQKKISINNTQKTIQEHLEAEAKNLENARKIQLRNPNTQAAPLKDLNAIFKLILDNITVPNTGLIVALNSYFSITPYKVYPDTKKSFQTIIETICDWITDLEDESLDWKHLKEDPNFSATMEDLFVFMESYGRFLVNSGELVEKLAGAMLMITAQLGSIRKDITRELFDLIGGLALRIKEILFPDPAKSVSIAKPLGKIKANNVPSISIQDLETACKKIKKNCAKAKNPQKKFQDTFQKKLKFKTDREKVIALGLLARETFASVKKVKSNSDFIIEKISDQANDQNIANKIAELKSLSDACDNFIRTFNRGNLTGYLMVSTFDSKFLADMKKALSNIITQVEKLVQAKFSYSDPYVKIYGKLISRDFSKQEALAIILAELGTVVSQNDLTTMSDTDKAKKTGDIFDLLVKNKKIIKVPKQTDRYRLSRKMVKYIIDNPSGTFEIDFTHLHSELIHFNDMIYDYATNSDPNDLHGFYCLYDLLKISLDLLKGRIPNPEKLERALNPIVIKSSLKTNQSTSANPPTYQSDTISMQNLLSYPLFYSDSNIQNINFLNLSPATDKDLANFRQDIIILFRGMQHTLNNPNSTSTSLRNNNQVKKCIEIAKNQQDSFVKDLKLLQYICRIIREYGFMLIKKSKKSVDEEKSESHDNTEIDLSYAITDEEIGKAQFYLQKFLKAIKLGEEDEDSSTYEADPEDIKIFSSQLKWLLGIVSASSLKEIFLSAIDYSTLKVALKLSINEEDIKKELISAIDDQKINQDAVNIEDSEKFAKSMKSAIDYANLRVALQLSINEEDIKEKLISVIDDQKLKKEVAKITEDFNATISSAISGKIWRYLPNYRSDPDSVKSPNYKACSLEIPQSTNMDNLELHFFEPDSNELEKIKNSEELKKLGNDILESQSYLVVLYRLPFAFLIDNNSVKEKKKNPVITALFKLNSSNPGGHFQIVINEIKLKGEKEKKAEKLTINYLGKTITIPGTHYRLPVYARSDMPTDKLFIKSDIKITDRLESNNLWNSIAKIMSDWGKSNYEGTYIKRINFLRSETAPYVQKLEQTTNENANEPLVDMVTMQNFFIAKEHQKFSPNADAKFDKTTATQFLTNLKNFCLKIDSILPNTLVIWLHHVFKVDRFSGSTLRDLSFYYIYFRILEYLLRPDSRQPPLHKILGERVISPPRVVLSDNGDLCINFIYSALSEEKTSNIPDLRVGYDFGVNGLISSSFFKSPYPPKPYGATAISTQFDEFCKDRGLEPVFNPFSLNTSWTGFQLINWNDKNNKKIFGHTLEERKFCILVDKLLDQRLSLRRIIRAKTKELNMLLHAKTPNHRYQIHKRILKLLAEKRSLWDKTRHTNDWIAKNAYALIKGVENTYKGNVNIILEDSRTLRGGGLSKTLNYRVGSMVRGQISELVENHFHSTPTAHSYYHPSAYTSQRCPQCGAIGTHVFFNVFFDAKKNSKGFSESESKAGNYFKCENTNCIMNKLFGVFSATINEPSIFSELDNDKYKLHKGSKILDTEPLLNDDCPAALQPLWTMIYFLNRDRAAACNVARGYKPESDLIKNSIIFLRTAAKIHKLRQANQNQKETERYFKNEHAIIRSWIRKNPDENTCKTNLDTWIQNKSGKKTIKHKDFPYVILEPYLGNSAGWFRILYTDVKLLFDKMNTVAGKVKKVKKVDPAKNQQLPDEIREILKKPKDIFLKLRENPPPSQPPIP